MITPDPAEPGEHGGKSAAQAAEGERVTRHNPARTAPNRAGTASKPKPKPKQPKQPKQPKYPHDHPDGTINDAIADAVKSSYDVLAESVKQGREAAERFRRGQYSVREVPEDAEHMVQRVLDLARQLSATTFDICENLVHLIAKGVTPPPPSQVKPCSPFPDPWYPGAPQPQKGSVPLQVVFKGNAKARSLTPSLRRPERPTLPRDIAAKPLESRDGSGTPIVTKHFTNDVSSGNLVVVVAIPAGQKPGLYSGLVLAKGIVKPLGSLDIEIEG